LALPLFSGSTSHTLFSCTLPYYFQFTPPTPKPEPKLEPQTLDLT
jgi:hypothetical protein